MAETRTGWLNRLHEAVFRRDQWNIGIIDAPIHTLLDRDARPTIRWLPEPKSGTYVTDPCGIEEGGSCYLFWEHFDYREYRGRLFAGRLDKQGRVEDAVELFDTPVHVSYPYVFNHEGNTYCVPEMARIRKVVLYEADELPGKWSKAGVLVDDFAAVDPTIFRHEDRWWLFCTNRDTDRRADLVAWYANDLLGPWRPHALSPVKSDARSARPAGTPFVHESRLYRPAQDCSEVYGGRVVINHVTRLTPDEFEEEVAAVVVPDRGGPYPDGVHTVSAVGDITLVDGKRTGFIWWALVGTLRKNLRRLMGRSVETWG